VIYGLYRLAPFPMTVCYLRGDFTCGKPNAISRSGYARWACRWLVWYVCDSELSCYIYAGQL